MKGKVGMVREWNHWGFREQGEKREGEGVGKWKANVKLSWVPETRRWNEENQRRRQRNNSSEDRKKTRTGECQGSWVLKARPSSQWHLVLPREVGKYWRVEKEGECWWYKEGKQRERTKKGHETWWRKEEKMRFGEGSEVVCFALFCFQYRGNKER